MRRGAFGVVTKISQITGKFEVHLFDGDVMWTTERKLDRVSTEGLKFYIERNERLGIDKITENLPEKISSARAKIKWYKKKIEDSKSAKNKALRNVIITLQFLNILEFVMQYVSSVVVLNLICIFVIMSLKRALKS